MESQVADKLLDAQIGIILCFCDAVEFEEADGYGRNVAQVSRRRSPMWFEGWYFCIDPPYLNNFNLEYYKITYIEVKKIMIRLIFFL